VQEAVETACGAPVHSANAFLEGNCTRPMHQDGAVQPSITA